MTLFLNRNCRHISPRRVIGKSNLRFMMDIVITRCILTRDTGGVIHCYGDLVVGGKASGPENWSDDVDHGNYIPTLRGKVSK